MITAVETSGICVPIPMNTRPNICNIQLMMFIDLGSVTGPKRYDNKKEILPLDNR